jgi:addiction module HigA family antidote
MHLVDLYQSAAACKAVYAGSIPTLASRQFKQLQ